MTNDTTIYVYLPDEAVDCWRPVPAQHLEGDRYVVLGIPPEDEIWEFSPGETVHCEPRRLSGNGGTVTERLVAIRRAE